MQLPFLYATLGGRVTKPYFRVSEGPGVKLMSVWRVLCRGRLLLEAWNDRCALPVSLLLTTRCDSIIPSNTNPETIYPSFHSVNTPWAPSMCCGGEVVNEKGLLSWSLHPSRSDRLLLTWEVKILSNP